MRNAIVDLRNNAVVGYASDGVTHEKHQLLVSLPDGFDISEAGEWVYDGTGLTRDVAALLDRARAARKARIKSEARALIEALDWRLERARERAEAGVSGVESVADVLALRETIRRSSSAAEDAVEALTDVASVVAFTWSVTRDEDGGA